MLIDIVDSYPLMAHDVVRIPTIFYSLSCLLQNHDEDDSLKHKVFSYFDRTLEEKSMSMDNNIVEPLM